MTELLTAIAGVGRILIFMAVTLLAVLHAADVVIGLCGSQRKGLREGALSSLKSLIPAARQGFVQMGRTRSLEVRRARWSRLLACAGSPGAYVASAS